MPRDPASSDGAMPDSGATTDSAYRKETRQELSSWVGSFLIHLGLLIVLALVGWSLPNRQRVSHLIATRDESSGGIQAGVRLNSQDDSARDEALALFSAEAELTELKVGPLVEDSSSTAVPGVREEGNSSRRWLLPRQAAGGGLLGRNGPLRERLLNDRGGTPETERAVGRGLRWLAAHQTNSGSWRFDLGGGLCQGQCRDPGTVSTTTGATAIALLAFLGAGHTHQEGEYAETMRMGIYYLLARMRNTPHGADFQEGTMYAQALSAIALCEAYSMSGDAQLKAPAQQAIDFIEYAQDRQGGGWRYSPGAPGDTTVTGWQLMALKSAQAAGLRVDSHVFSLTDHFLDSVQNDSGAAYGYRDDKPGDATTAVGLLSRMYLGWHRDHPALERGLARLAEHGPSPENMYFNYYATQVLSHAGGADWETWNAEMTSMLLRTQATGGHESGSWYFAAGHGNKGGRLYNTAMAVMTLEVYYRYLPLYRPVVLDEDF